ncbi:hypothetical protein ID866_6830 [Astraeus odoratus]|nr:hypothetical protein ID866_6830 [Astraeus odoratus]
MRRFDNEKTRPPPYSQSSEAHPPSGFRVALDASATFPEHLAGKAPCFDADGFSPVFIGSAILEDNSVHPCKVAPRLIPVCRVPYAGVELAHYGRYDVLPFDPDTMEWVPASRGRVPHGCNPVPGGYEENGSQLYHAIGVVDGVRVPGKTGIHLGACHVAFNGTEHVITHNYEILCWRC